MPISFAEGLESGGRLLIPFAGTGRFVGLVGEKVAPVRGEIDLAFTPGATEVSLFRLGLTCAGVEIGEGSTSTGQFGIRGVDGTGTLEPLEEGAWTLQVQFQGFQAYDALTRSMRRRFVPPDRFTAPMESLKGSLNGVLREDGEGVERSIHFSGSFRFDSLPGQELRWVHSFRMDLANNAIWPLFLAEDPAAQVEHQRRLKIRPVRLLDKCDDPAPTGAGVNAKAQFESAKHIWGKCCIKLEVLEPVERIDAALKTSGMPELVADSFKDPDENTVEVFFVDHPLDSFGGGATCSCGWNTAKIVLTEHSESNPNLLAHELGHVFAGLHPNQNSSTFFWKGDVKTVLQATLYSGQKNPDRNTLSNCGHAHNPALASISPHPCRLHPDERFLPAALQTK